MPPPSSTVATASESLQRSSGAIRVSFKRQGSRTVLDRLYQDGCCKARFPRPEWTRPPEAVLINTSGGLTDGDRLSVDAAWQADTRALVTTQAAERIYRSREGVARISTTLEVGERAAAYWLPQETILFDAGRLDRTTDVWMSRDASLFAVESIVFGRAGMGETTASGRVFDRWRIRIDGMLVFADALRLDDSGNAGLDRQLDRAAVMGDARAMATMIYVGEDAASRLAGFRQALARCDVIGGASDLGPLVVARVVATSSQQLRAAIASVFEAVGDDGRQNLQLPRVWNC